MEKGRAESPRNGARRRRDVARMALRRVEGRVVYENGFGGEVWWFGISTAQTTTTHY